MLFYFFFSSRRRHTRCALVTGVQTCALPICAPGANKGSDGGVRACVDASITYLALSSTFRRQIETVAGTIIYRSPPKISSATRPNLAEKYDIAGVHRFVTGL